MERRVLAGVQSESLSKCPGLWFGVFGPLLWLFLTAPKGLPVTPDYLGLGMALDVTVTASVTPPWTVKGVQKARSALALYSPSG